MIEVISLVKILAGRSPTTVGPSRHQQGALPPNEASVLMAIACAEQPNSVFEIGTYCGHTTLHFARNLPYATIHTIDLPEEVDCFPLKTDYHLITDREVGREYQGQPGAERIIQHRGDTATWDFSQVTGASFFFIDGSHTYEYAKNDTEKCFDVCGGKGVFLWHDCDDRHPGVMQFLSEWRKEILLISGTCLAYGKFI